MVLAAQLAQLDALPTERSAALPAAGPRRTLPTFQNVLAVVERYWLLHPQTILSVAKCFVPLRRGNMSKSGQSALNRLKEITNTHATGRKRKDDADENHKDAKGGPGQGTFGGEGFTEAQLNQLARLIDCSVTSAVEKSVGSLKQDMV